FGLLQVLEILHEQCLGALPLSTSRCFCIVQFPDPPVLFSVPAINPVSHIKGSIGTEIHPCGKNSFENHFGFSQLEGSAFGVQLKSMDPGLSGIPYKFRYKEVVFPTFP